MVRYIFVTGGVVSSLGKGLAAASLGALLQGHGYKVRIRKFDPYLNVDPGTMNPCQHGEVYVTDDGAETDLDLGHYERFTGVPSRRSDSITSGRIYASVIQRERRGDYLGSTVQVVPHITDAIQEAILQDHDPDLDFLICEIGGTVGDIEGLPFFEAIRQFANTQGHGSCLFIHLTWVPYIPSADELKTKPSQHSVKELLHVGIQPQMLLCRSDRPIPAAAKGKLALFCNIQPDYVIDAPDLDTIYEAPIRYAHGGFDRMVLRYFALDSRKTPDLTPWHQVVRHLKSPKNQVRIAVVGKYMALKDAYKSLHEALIHGGFAAGTGVQIDWIDGETLTQEQGGVTVPLGPDALLARLGDADGILVPGGYGVRGTVGMLAAIRFARERGVPFLGICFGMQLSVIETLRSLGGVSGADSTEFGDAADPVVGPLTTWRHGDETRTQSVHGDMGGTMRLGAYPCVIQRSSRAHDAYGTDRVTERHRHRYEVSLAYQGHLKAGGMVITGLSPDGLLPEIVERPDHPWFVGVQFHPELTSRPLNPHPLFTAYVGAALSHHQQRPVSRRFA